MRCSPPDHRPGPCRRRRARSLLESAWLVWLVASPACDRGSPPAPPATPSARPTSPVPAESPADLVKVGRFVEAESRLRARLEGSAGAGDSSAAGQLHYLLALALGGQGRFEEALEAIDQAGRRASQNPEVWRAHGNLLLKAGRAPEAVETYRRALGLARLFRRRTGLPLPDAHRWRYELAQALRHAGRREEAARELDIYRAAQNDEIELRALEERARHERSATAYCEHAAALTRAGRLREAMEALRAALEMDDACAAAHLGMARAVLLALSPGAPGPQRRSTLDLARGHACRALELEESPAVHLVLARVAWLAGDPNLAEEAIGRAIELAPHDPDVHREAEEVRR